MTTKLAITVGALSLLAALASAKNTEAGFLSVPIGNEDLAPLLQEGFAEQNAAILSESGAATRITEAGEKFHAEQNSETAGQVAANDTGSKPASQTFVVGNFTIPEKAKAKRNVGARGPVYPFADVPAPTEDNKTPGFFVPATEKMKEPWKTLQSAVGNYNREHGKVTGEKTINVKGVDRIRKEYDYTVEFAVAEGDHNGVHGAIVYRVK